MNDKLILPENFNVTIENASLVLADNKTRVSRASDYGKSLLLNYSKNGVTEATYKAGLEYLSKVSKTVNLMNSNRKPVTQFLSEIAKQFTSLEAELALNDKTIPGQVKFKIDQFAKEVARKKKELELLAENKLKKERQVNELETEIKTSINKSYYAYFNHVVLSINKIWDNIKLSNFDSISNDIIESEYSLPEKYFDNIVLKQNYSMILEKEKQEIVSNIIGEQYPELAQKFTKDIDEVKHDIIVQFDEKFAELQEIAKADKKLAEEMKIAAAEKSAKLSKEQKERFEASESLASKEIENQKIASNLMGMFDANPTSPDIKIREFTEIQVIDPSGWVELLLFYFEREGKLLTEEKLEKKFGFAKKFAESVYNKEDVKITSKYLQYVETAKSK